MPEIRWNELASSNTPGSWKPLSVLPWNQHAGFLLPDLPSLPRGLWASHSPLHACFPVSEMGAMLTLGLLEEFMKPQ